MREVTLHLTWHSTTDFFIATLLFLWLWLDNIVNDGVKEDTTNTNTTSKKFHRIKRFPKNNLEIRAQPTVYLQTNRNGPALQHVSGVHYPPRTPRGRANRIFIDGSKRQRDKGSEALPETHPSGAGVYIEEGRTRDGMHRPALYLCLEMGQPHDIGRAEILAALHAVTHAPALGPEATWDIFSDSLATLFILLKNRHKPMDTQDHIYLPILLQIAQICKDREETFHFHHVNSHVGIIGNELADILAKIAAQIIPREAFPMYDIQISRHDGISHVPRGATLVSHWYVLNSPTLTRDDVVIPEEPPPADIMMHHPELHSETVRQRNSEPTDPKKYTWYNLKKEVKRARKTKFTWWRQEDKDKDKWTALFNKLDDTGLVSNYLCPLSKLPKGIAHQVRRCRYNQFLTNGSERLAARIHARGLSTACPICGGEGDNQLHCLGPCTDPQIQATQTKHHDKIVADCAVRHSAASASTHTLFADASGYRPGQVLRHLEHVPPETATDIASDSDDSDSQEGEPDLETVVHTEPAPDTPATPARGNTPPTDDLIEPYSFQDIQHLDTELRHMEDQSDTPHNVPGSLHNLRLEIDDNLILEGNYRLLDISMHKITREIWADIEHTDTHVTSRIRWALMNRYKSRTIPREIDADTSLCPDLFRIINLPTGAPIPTRPNSRYILQLGDVAYGRETDLGDTRHRKIQKYEHLLAKWKAQGWKVDPHVRVIALGHRGGIPCYTGRNIAPLGLCSEKTPPKTICTRWSQLACIRLGEILLQRRALEHSPQHAAKSAVAMKVWLQAPDINPATT